MTTIITGNFQQQDAAQRALIALASAGFAADQTTTFFVNPPGQHDQFPVGGDEDESPGTQEAAGGAIGGALAGGGIGVAAALVALPILGPAAVAAGAGVGAYAGSLLGALGKVDDTNNPPTTAPRDQTPAGDSPRKSGVLVAVAAAATAQQETVIRILREYGATDSERTEGTIIAGEWTDFNPLQPLQPVGARHLNQ